MSSKQTITGNGGGGGHEYVQQSEYMFLLRYISVDVYLFKICQKCIPILWFLSCLSSFSTDI